MKDDLEMVKITLGAFANSQLTSIVDNNKYIDIYADSPSGEEILLIVLKGENLLSGLNEKANIVKVDSETLFPYILTTKQKKLELIFKGVINSVDNNNDRDRMLSLTAGDLIDMVDGEKADDGDLIVREYLIRKSNL